MVVTTVVTTTTLPEKHARFAIQETDESSTDSRRTSLSSATTALASQTYQPKNVSWVRNHAASYKSYEVTLSGSLIQAVEINTRDTALTLSAEVYGKNTSIRAYTGDDLHAPAVAVTRIGHDGMDVCFHPDEPQTRTWGFQNPTTSSDGMNWIPCASKSAGKGFAFDLPQGLESRRVQWKRTHDEELQSWNFSTSDWKLVDAQTNEVLVVFLGKMGKGGKLNWHGEVGGKEGEVVILASIMAFTSLGVKIGTGNSQGSTNSSRLNSSVGAKSVF